MLSIALTLLAMLPAADERAIHDAPLYSVRFVDKNEGWAGGADGVMWHTIDGGATWERQPLPTKGTIHALQFLTPYTGYAAGREEVQATGQSVGVLLNTKDGGLTWRRIDTASISGLNRVRFADDSNGLIATVTGHEYRTTNGGLNWMKSDVRSDHLDPKPGRFPGPPRPWNDLHFADENNGWAVGEFGTIHATNNGGKTWTVQKCGGQRAAILCVHAKDANIPLDLVAALGAADGYLIHCLAVTSGNNHAVRKLRAATAVRKAGGASADTLVGWMVPPELEATDPQHLRNFWNKNNNDEDLGKLKENLVLQFRTWQPEVVICDFAGGPAETLVVEAVQEAVKNAADATAFPEQIKTGKLTPWQVKKLFGLWDGPGASHITVRTDDVSPVLGESPRDHANKVIGLIAEKASLPKSRGLRLLAHNMPGGAGLNGIMDGIVLAPNGTARRPAAVVQRDVKDPNEKHVRELTNLVNIAQSGLPQVGDPASVLANMGKALDKLPPEEGLKALLAMGAQAAKSGNWPLARETYELGLNRYPNLAANADAIRWLMSYYSSSPTRQMSDAKTTATVARADFAASTSTRPLFEPNESVQPLTNSGINVTQKTVSDPSAARNWFQRALALEAKLAPLGPEATNDPTIVLPLAAAKRQLGFGDGGKSHIRKILADPATPESWRITARQELWFDDRRGPAPRFAVNCLKSGKRPYLDAKFDDECWADVPAFAVPQRDQLPGHSTSVRFAFDDEFLYVTIECQHPESAFHKKVEHRERDANVQPFDHVELILDLDRNYATYYRFCIDQRGALAEDCWGNPKWNPRWYVAFESSSHRYAAEMAIHLSDLTNEPVSIAKAWAMNVVRVVPGNASMTGQPGEMPPTGSCGLLMFAEPK